MPNINVVKAFVLTLKDGAKKEFCIGVHAVENEVAKHWYTQAHTEDIPSAKPKSKDTDEAKADESKTDDPAEQEGKAS